MNNLTTTKPSWIMLLFWKACGADRKILERCDYREHVKYFCLGGIVIATGVMAGLAGGYAFYTIFEPKGSAFETGTDTQTLILSIVFGIIWGSIIFNIDRFIVASTGQGDGTEAITREEFIGALPRIFLGIIIAITISKPLEIRIFKTEIDTQLRREQLIEAQKFREEVNTLFEQQISEKKARINELNSEIDEKEDKRDEYQNELNKEIQGKVGSGREGYGPAARSIETSLAKAQSELNEVQEKNEKKIRILERELGELEKQREEEFKKGDTAANSLDGLLERIKISHKVAGWGISIFITLLFVAIELTPIFFKLMLIKSPYDFLSDNEKEIRKAMAGVEVKYNYYQDQKGKERDLVIYYDVERIKDEQQKLTEAQKELNDYILSKWLEKEKRKIDSSPEDYIRVDNNGDSFSNA